VGFSANWRDCTVLSEKEDGSQYERKMAGGVFQAASIVLYYTTLYFTSFSLRLSSRSLTVLFACSNLCS
jgi:hypothetical protein